MRWAPKCSLVNASREWPRGANFWIPPAYWGKISLDLINPQASFIFMIFPEVFCNCGNSKSVIFYAALHGTPVVLPEEVADAYVYCRQVI